MWACSTEQSLVTSVIKYKVILLKVENVLRKAPLIDQVVCFYNSSANHVARMRKKVIPVQKRKNSKS